MSERAGIDGAALVRLIVERLDEERRVATWILQDVQAAEDAVQEAAMLAWDRRATLRDRDAADAWFGRIVVNVCREELRRRSRRPRVIELVVAADVPDSRAAPGDPGVRDEVARALARLDRDEQVLLALRFGRDLAVPQIAARLALPEGTVKSRLHAALGHMNAALAAERRAEEATECPA
jgi:RNA polymerase sigma-70 factor (ECF subfamily)